MAAAKGHTAEVKEYVDTPAPQSYVWSFPGAPIRVHLSLEVVKRLALRLRVNNGAAPFGLLLGHVDGLATIVSGFQPLAAAEAREIEPALARLAALPGRSSVVGYYRAQPQGKKPEGLHLDEKDMALAERLFRDPSNVILLVQTAEAGPANATFFFRDGGRLNGDFPFLEFPFDAPLLAAAEQRRVEAAQRRSFEVFSPPPRPRPCRSAPNRNAGESGRVVVWALLAACAGGGAAVGVRYFLEKSPLSPAAPAAIQPAATVPAPQASLGLQAERQNADLKVTWNRDAAAIYNATLGVISIKDGNLRRTISLQAAEVRTGSLLYTPVNDQVQMELAVATPTGNATESVLVLLPKTGPARTVAAQPLVPVQPARPAPESASRQPARPFTPPSAPPRQSAPAPALAEPPALAAGANPAPPTAAPLWNRPALSVQPPPAPLALSAPPAADPQSQRASAVAPVYHAPEPIHQVQPVFPASLTNTVTRTAVVEVLVSIDETGKVVKADPKSQPGVHPWILASAVAAARQWTFRPARRGDQPVPSQMILRFNFTPAR